MRQIVVRLGRESWWLAALLLALAIFATAEARAEDAAERTYENRLTRLVNPPPLLADHPEFVEPVHEIAALRSAAVGRRSGGRSARAGLAIFVQRPRHHRNAQPAGSRPHGPDHGASLGRRRRPGLAHSRAGRRGRLLHAGKKSSGRPAHARSDQPAAQVAARQGGAGDVQPAGQRRSDSQEDVSLVHVAPRRSGPPPRGRGTGRQAQRLRLPGRDRAAATEALGRQAGDRLFPAVQRPRRPARGSTTPASGTCRFR